MHSTLDHGIDGAGGAQRPRHRGVYFAKRNFVEVALAAKANMSPALFRKRFTATAGMSVHSYVLKERIERACELIDECNLPLATIAAQCGFSSQSHMTKIFRRELGATRRSCVAAPTAAMWQPNRNFRTALRRRLMAGRPELLGRTDRSRSRARSGPGTGSDFEAKIAWYTLVLHVERPRLQGSDALAALGLGAKTPTANGAVIRCKCGLIAVARRSSEKTI